MQVDGADRSQIMTALRNAAAATGSDFHNLLGIAMRESGLRPDARSATSSATGLFQFVDQTWLGLVKEHGARHGLSDMANAITKDASGRYHAEGVMRQSILALRKDPQTAAIMAGEHAKTLQGALSANLGRAVCGGELYAAHFLGADAACKLIKMSSSDPGASAVAQFPQAASANKTVFFHADGQPKSVREVYDWALRQPGETAPTSSLSLTARYTIATAQDAQVRMLLADVMNWQPGGGAGVTPLSFGSSLLALLSQARSEG